MPLRKLKPIALWTVGLALTMSACKNQDKSVTPTKQEQVLKTFELPVPVDTRSKKVTVDKRRIFTVNDVTASNEFKGARLNDFYEEDGQLIAEIRPENTPINNSAWYAFSVTSKTPGMQKIHLKYKNGKHRYAPKVSKDFENWSLLESVKHIDSVTVQLEVETDSIPLYIAAQPVQNSDIVAQWMQSMVQKSHVKLNTIGRSTGGVPMERLTIGNTIGNPTIVLIGRQHPPEVTGWFAQKEFVEYLLKDDALQRQFFESFNLIVYPLLNPDGVDLGHWRTGLGGVDLNRDWAYYHQLETKQTASSIVDYANTYHSDVVLGVDFHSTYYDVFYENHDPEFNLTIPDLKQNWIAAIQNAMPEETFKVSEIEIGKPISMDWFSRQFGAAGVTYEIGDNTPYEKIQLKAKNAAITMMDLLLEWKQDNSTE